MYILDVIMRHHASPNDEGNRGYSWSDNILNSDQRHEDRREH